MRPVALAGVFLALFLQAGAALAHAALVASDPVDGAVLATAPSQLGLTFNEPVSPLVLRLIDDTGTATDLSFRVDGNRVLVDLPGTPANGSHAFSWRVISEDGHPVGGTILFSVGAPGTRPVPVDGEAVDWTLRMAIWLCRVLLYGALFLGVGGVFFGMFMVRDGRPLMPVQQVLLTAGLVVAPLSVALQGLDALNAPFSSLGQALIWRTALDTSWSATAITAFLAFVAALVGGRRRDRAGGVLATLAFIGVGAALAGSGHASAAQPQWLMRPAVFVHTLAVAFWVGALIPLARALRRGDGQTLIRFSRSIPFVLAALVLTGLGLAVVQVERTAALAETAYGRVLLVKLAVVAFLLALAAVNRWRLTVPSLAGDRAALGRLVMMIAVETALAVAILGVVATWRFTPPPRALAAAAAQPALLHIHTDRAMADITLAPGRAGPVVASVYLMTGDFAPLAAREVTLLLSSPDLGIEPVSRVAARGEDGRWRVDGLVVPAAGRWNIELAVLISDFDLVRIRDSIEIRR